MKKIVFIILTILSFIIIYKSSINIFTNNSKKDNFQFGNIKETNSLPSGIVDYPILKGNVITFAFKSNYNNLGIVELLINNNNRINKDKIFFRLKESGKNQTLYEATYDTSIMDEGQVFPFGFPVQSNSKGKTYVVEIVSINGSKNDSVSISSKSNNFITKYIVDRRDVYKNPVGTFIFAFKKIQEISGYFNIIDYLKIYLFSTIPFLLTFLSILIYYHMNLKLKIKFKLNYGLILILIIYYVSHIKFIHYSQFWDSEWYFQLLLSAISSVNNYTGNFIGLINVILRNYNFLGHSSMGYVFILSLGQIIDFGNIVYLNLTNVILGSAAIVGFYYFVTYLNPKNNPNNLIATMIFAFNPLFFATSISLNLDYSVLIFLTLAVTSLFYKNYNFFIVFSLLLVFSKETGLLFYISIVLTILFFKFDEFKRHMLLFAMPVLLFLIYLYYNSWNLWNSGATVNEGNKLSLNFANNKMFSLGINIENIKIRLFQIFIMNFNWILSPFVFIGLFKVKDKNYKFLSCLLIPFLLFNLFYTVMPFSRYVVSSVFILISLFYISVGEIIKNRLHVRLILVTVAFLMFIQIYKSIDSSPKLFYGKNLIGSNVSSPVFGFRDGLVYNTSFYFVEELSKLIRIRQNKSEGIVLNTGAQYFFKQIDDIGTVENVNKINHKYKNLEYVYVSWFGDLDSSLDQLRKFYTISYKNRIDYKGYYVDVYNLKAI